MSHLITDVFNDDAFSLSTLTAQINNIDHVPGRAGSLVFTEVSAGIPTDTVVVERVGDAIELIQTSHREAPAEQERESKRQLLSFKVPHIKLEQTIYAHEIQDIAGRFGENGNPPPSDPFGDRLRGAQHVVSKQMKKMAGRHDLTIEHHRLGALKGVIRDADGSVLVDLFSEFGFLNSDDQPEPEQFDFDLDNWSAEIRPKCSAVIRAMKRNAKMPIPADAKVWGFAGDNFIDKLLEHPNIKKVWNGTASAKSRLGDSYVNGVFEFGGIFFENYTGTDDNTTVAIDPDECRFFFTDVPGLYQESFSPGDFLDTVNKPGLPRYARIAQDGKVNQRTGQFEGMNRWVKLHTQQNPLPLCLRPQTLMMAT